MLCFLPSRFFALLLDLARAHGDGMLQAHLEVLTRGAGAKCVRVLCCRLLRLRLRRLRQLVLSLQAEVVLVQSSYNLLKRRPVCEDKIRFDGAYKVTRAQLIQMSACLRVQKHIQYERVSRLCMRAQAFSACVHVRVC